MVQSASSVHKAISLLAHALATKLNAFLGVLSTSLQEAQPGYQLDTIDQPHYASSATQRANNACLCNRTTYYQSGGRY